jgi:hypothetical protein
MEVEVKDRKSTFAEIDKLVADKNKYWQIDLLKVICMVLVIMDHSFTHDSLYRLASPFWQRIAIPMFMIIIGFNWSKSMEKRKDEPLYKLFSWKNYFKKKFVRFGLPFGIIYSLSLFLYIGMLFIPDSLIKDTGGYSAPILKVFLFLPVWGPGNWFIPTLFLTIFVFPLIFWAFKKQPVLALAGCFVLEILYHLFVYGVIAEYYQNHPEWNIGVIYTFLVCNPFILLSAIGLGVWLSQDFKWDSPHNIIIYILGIGSFIYLIYYTFIRVPLNPINFGTVSDPIYLNRVFGFINGDYNFLVYPWSAVLIITALNTIPKEPYGKTYRFVSKLSDSTYHILMVQMFYFSIVYNLFLPMFGRFPIWASLHTEFYWANYLWYYPLNVALTFGIGYLWKTVEDEYFWNRKKRFSKNRLALLKSKGLIK